MTHHALLFTAAFNPDQRSAGAHRIATFLRAQGWDVEVCDFAAHWPLEHLQEFARSRITSRTVFVGFSVFIDWWTPTLQQFVSWLKTQWPDVATVIGGQNVCNLPDIADMDYWIDSYGEAAILALAQGLIGNSTAGIKWDFNWLGRRRVIKALNSYPSYPLDSYAVLYQKRDYVQPWEWGTMEFSRGCVFNCDFCNFPILGVKGDYSHSQASFELQLRHNYDEFGITNYFVADETFNDSVDKIIKFADVTDRVGFRPFFSGFIRFELMLTRPQSWEHLVRLNMGAQYYGIESMNHESGKAIGKGMDPARIKQGLLDVKQYFSSHGFYRGTVSLIVGLPHETPESFENTMSWLVENWQGQSISTFPLDVPQMTEDMTNHSKMTKNFAKYGLREMVDPPELKLPRGYQETFQLGLKRSVMWEHDTMNKVQAIELDIAARNIIDANKLGMNSWYIDAPQINAQRVIPFDDPVYHNGIVHKDREMQRKFIREYIAYKLNN